MMINVTFLRCCLTIAVISFEIVSSPCYAQKEKAYPLIGRWEAVPVSVELKCTTAAYPVAYFSVHLDLQQSFVTISFSSVSAHGWRVDCSDQPQVTFKKSKIKGKRSITFKALYPYAGVKGKLVSL